MEIDISCPEILITPLPKSHKFTDVAVAARPVLVRSPPVQLAFWVVIFVPFARPVMVKVKVGSTVA